MSRIDPGDIGVFGGPGTVILGEQDAGAPITEDAPLGQGAASHAVGRWSYAACLYLDSGTEYFSDKYVQHPNYLYEGRVLSWGHCERSIPVPAGIPRVGDCLIRLADTDRHWRNLLIQQTPRRRLIEIRRIREGESQSTYAVIGTYEVLDFVFPQDVAEIRGRDISFSWLDKPILPNLGNRTNFPGMTEETDEKFGNIIVGHNYSNPNNLQGVIPCPHLGYMAITTSPITSPATMVDRFFLAAHPIATASQGGGQAPIVYRRYPDESTFTVVSSGYTITEDSPTVIDGVQYSFTYVDFTSQQTPVPEIRVDCDGYYFRGDFGSMSAVTSSTGPLRNPIDFLINLLYLALRNEGGTLQTTRFNIQSFIDARAKFEGSFYSPTTFEYLCDGAIISGISVRSALAQLASDFEFDLFYNRFGELEVVVHLTTDANRPVFNDTDHFLKGSVVARLPEATRNRFVIRYDKNFATGEYARTAVYDNTSDQAAIALPSQTSPVTYTPYIEEEIIERHFIRDVDTNLQSIARRAEFLALGSYRVEAHLPSPEVFDDIELAKLIGVTHYGGLDTNGWTNAEFKITDIVHYLDDFKTRIKAILRVPQPVPAPTTPTTIQGALHIQLEAIDRPLTSVTTGATTFRRTSFRLKTADFPASTTFSLDCVFHNTDAVTRTVSIVDSTNTVVVSFTLPASTGTAVAPELTTAIATWSPTNPNDVYRIRIPQSTSTSSVGLYSIRVVCHIPLDIDGTIPTGTITGIEIPLTAEDAASGIDQSAGDGDLFRTTSTSYTAFGSHGSIWKYTASEWASVTAFRWSFVMASILSSSSGVQGAKCCLWDITAGAAVAGSELELPNGTASVTPTLVEAELGTGVLINNHEYEPRIKSLGAYNAFAHKARVMLTLSPMTAGFFPWRVSKGDLSVQCRQKMVGIGVETFLEVVGTSASVRYWLGDAGSSDSGAPGTEVSGSSLTYTGTKAIRRSGTFETSLILNSRYLGGSDSPPGPQDTVQALLMQNPF